MAAVDEVRMVLEQAIPDFRDRSGEDRILRAFH